MLYFASRITAIRASTTLRLSLRSGDRNMFFTSCCVSVEVPRTAPPRAAPWRTAPTSRRNEMPPWREEVPVLGRENGVEDHRGDLIERDERAVLHLLVVDGAHDFRLEHDVGQRRPVV